MSEDIAVETFVIDNPDGTISLDAYAGMTREQLKERCGGLCRALSEWQFIAMCMAERGKDGLPEVWRQKVERLIEAYED